MPRSPESGSYIYKVTPQNCGADVVFRANSEVDPPENPKTFRCHQLRKEFGFYGWVNTRAQQKLTGTVQGDLVPEHVDYESNCMRSECPYYEPVGIRAIPLIGRLIRSREPKTSLSDAVWFKRTQERNSKKLMLSECLEHKTPQIQ